MKISTGRLKSYDWKVLGQKLPRRRRRLLHFNEAFEEVEGVVEVIKSFKDHLLMLLLVLDDNEFYHTRRRTTISNNFFLYKQYKIFTFY